MVVNNRKKNSRQRGSHTHGWGAMKKHRGAGNRGGRGRSGSGKRGEAQKPNLLWEKGKKAKGKVGFTSRTNPISSISIKDLSKLKSENDVFDLTKLGFDKLLSNGKVDKKLTIKVVKYSAKAKEKIEAAGGKVES